MPSIIRFELSNSIALQFLTYTEHKCSIFKKALYLFVLLTIPENNSRGRLVSFDSYAKSGRFFDALHYDIGVQASVLYTLRNPCDNVKVLAPRDWSVKDKMVMFRT